MGAVPRRRFLIASSALLAAPAGLFAQQAAKVYQIGALLFTTPTPEELKKSTFLHALAQRGWIEGKNIVIERRAVDGKQERFDELAAELVRLNVDIIVTAGPGVKAARRATRTIPIVAVGVNEPVEMGYAESLAHPGGNVTGLTWEAGLTIDSKTFEFLHEAVPSAKRIAVLAQPAEVGKRPYLEGIPPVARARNVELLVVEVAKPEEFEGAFARMKEGRADSVFVPATPVFYFHRTRIAELALKHRLPMGGSNVGLAEAGGLIGFSAVFTNYFPRAADYVDKILRGAKPGDLPFEQPTKFQLAVNLKTAKLLGLTIPQTMLLRADRVIE
jgi:putative ABC transport system substrate-binding protein